jgi:hypothetical protein
VRVVEDRAASSDDDGERRCADQRRSAREASSRQRESLSHATLLAPNPEEVCGKRKEQRPPAEVEREPESRLGGRIEPGDLRVRPRRKAAVQKQIVFDAEVASEVPRHRYEKHEHIRHVLLVDQHVNDHGQRGCQQILRQQQAIQHLSVKGEVVAIGAVDRLYRHSGEEEDRQHGHEHEREPEELADHRE